jgi:hypothetical protein
MLVVATHGSYFIDKFFLDLVFGQRTLDPVVKTCSFALFDDILVQIGRKSHYQWSLPLLIISEVVCLLTQSQIFDSIIQLEDGVNAMFLMILSFSDLLASLIAIHDGHIKV